MTDRSLPPSSGMKQWVAWVDNAIKVLQRGDYFKGRVSVGAFQVGNILIDDLRDVEHPAPVAVRFKDKLSGVECILPLPCEETEEFSQTLQLSAQLTGPSLGQAVLNWSTFEFNDSGFTHSGNGMTVPVGGVYLITIIIVNQITHMGFTGTWFEVDVLHNNAARVHMRDPWIEINTGSSIYETTINVSNLIKLAGGDTISTKYAADNVGSGGSLAGYFGLSYVGP